MYICVCAYVCMHVCIYVCLYVYTCIYICMYTYTYIYISAKNIITLFVSSDDFSCLICDWKTPNRDYSVYMYEWRKKGKKLYKFKFSGESKGG